MDESPIEHQKEQVVVVEEEHEAPGNNLAQELREAELAQTAASNELNFHRFAEEMSPVSSPKNQKATSRVRYVSYMFLSFYLFFGILLMANNSHLNHEDRLMSKIIGLSVSEATMEMIFEFEISMLLSCAVLGFFAFIHKGYRLFLIFAGLILFTIILTVLVICISMRSYSEIGQSIDDRHKVIDQMKSAMNQYDWFSVSDRNSDFVNKLQFEFSCCGDQNGYKDWEKVKPNSVPFGAFPISCCPLRLDFAGIRWCTYDEVAHQPDCPSAFTAHLIHLSNIFRTMNILLFESLIMQFLAVAIFFYLIINRVKNV